MEVRGVDCGGGIGDGFGGGFVDGFGDDGGGVDGASKSDLSDVKRFQHRVHKE